MILALKTTVQNEVLSSFYKKRVNFMLKIAHLLVTLPKWEAWSIATALVPFT